MQLKFKIMSCTVAFTALCACWSQEEVYELPPVITYIDSPVVEQRQVFSSDDIEKTHSESLVAFLSSAGIQILSYGPYGLESKPSIRGFTDETVRVLIDGVCVNNSQYGTFDFSTLSLDSIERIEISRGGFTEGVQDEGAVGGVISITTKRQSRDTSFFIDTYAKTFFNENKVLDTMGQSFGLNFPLGENTTVCTDIKKTFAANAFPFVSSLNKNEVRENSRVIDTSGNLNVTRFFGYGNYFRFGEMFYLGNKETPGPEYSSDQGKQNDVNNKLTASIFLPSLADSLSINSNLSWQYNHRDYDSHTEDSCHRLDSIIFATEAFLYKYRNVTQSVGLSLQADLLDSTNDGEHNIYSATLKETTKIHVNDVFSIIIPLAIKKSSNNYAFVPKLGVRADFKNIDVVLNGYRMVQFPIMDDLFWGESAGARGNPDLRPEKGWGSEFIMNFHDIWLPLSLCVYTNYYNEKIQWAYSDGIWTPSNVASAFYMGFNAGAEKTIFEKLRLRCQFEYLYTRLLDESNKYTYGKKIMWTPDLVFSVSADYSFKYLNLGLEGNYTGKRYTSNMNLYAMDPYFLLNARAEFVCFHRSLLYVRADNILNVKYTAVENYPMPGVSLTLGLRIK